MRIRRSVAILLGLSSVASAAWADTVHLTNGRKFENVVAEMAIAFQRYRLKHGALPPSPESFSRDV